MPGRDRTGPFGQGPLSGRRLGPCMESRVAKCGAGLGAGIGMGLLVRFGLNSKFGQRLRTRFGSKRNRNGVLSAERESLHDEKSLLQERLAEIDARLEEIGQAGGDAPDPEAEK